jgi:organic radical activating enzyme
MILNKKCLDELQAPGSPIIIFACIRETEAIINICKEKNIKIDAICDNEIRKCNQKFCGIDVIYTPNLKTHFNNARFLIAALQIQDSLQQLSEMGYDSFYSAMEILQNYDSLKYVHQVSNKIIKDRVDVYLLNHKSYFDKKTVYMRSLDIMVTERCSLKCESCSNLMQYYKNAKNADEDITFKSLEVLKKYVDDISEFRMIGGEPLMNKKWYEIVHKVQLDYPEKKILIYTNGTIAPKDFTLENLNKKQVSFIITSYGSLSKNLENLKSQLDKFKLDYTCTPAENWVDCSNIKHHKRSKHDLLQVFKECCAKYTYTLLNSKLYRCPWIANANNLRAIPDDKRNYVDLLADDENLKQKIIKLINVYSFFPACDFCDGRPYDPLSKKGYSGKGIIKAGIQTKKVIEYETY